MSYREHNRDKEIPRMLSVEEVTRILGISRKTLYRYVSNRDIVAYKFGRNLKFKPKDLEEFIEKHKKG